MKKIVNDFGRFRIVSESLPGDAGMHTFFLDRKVAANSWKNKYNSSSYTACLIEMSVQMAKVSEMIVPDEPMADYKREFLIDSISDDLRSLSHSDLCVVYKWVRKAIADVETPELKRKEKEYA